MIRLIQLCLQLLYALFGIFCLGARVLPGRLQLLQFLSDVGDFLAANDDFLLQAFSMLTPLVESRTQVRSLLGQHIRFLLQRSGAVFEVAQRIAELASSISAKTIRSSIATTCSRNSRNFALSR